MNNEYTDIQNENTESQTEREHLDAEFLGEDFSSTDYDIYEVERSVRNALRNKNISPEDVHAAVLRGFEIYNQN